MPSTEMNTFTTTLCGTLMLRCGKGNLKQQEIEYSSEVELPLTSSADQPLPIRFASSSGGGVDHPLRESTGYSSPVSSLTLRDAWEFIVANKHVANVNMAYECILGDASYDMPSSVAIDLDNKNPNNFRFLPNLEYTWNVNKFLDWVLPGLVTALNELCPGLEPPLSERDLYVSNASKPFRAENVQDYEEHGLPISLHIKVDRVKFAGQSDRNAFAHFLADKLPHLTSFIDTSVYGRNRNMRLLGSQKFNRVPLLPYSRGGRYKDAMEYAHWYDIPVDTIVDHCWSLPASHCVRLFSDDTAGPYLSRLKAGGGGRAKPQRAPAVAEDSDDPHVAVVLGIYEQYARTHGIPFDRSHATYKVTYYTGGDYEVYVQHREGTVRTCPLGRVHESNNCKLIVRGNSVFYFCFSTAPRDCGTVHKAVDEGSRQVMLSSCRTSARTYCCEVYVGDLPFHMFEIATDWERPPRKDVNGVLREDEVTPQVQETMKELVAKAAGCLKEELQGVCALVRSTYGSGKTEVWVKELVAQFLLRNPLARIAYVANSIALTNDKCQEINEYVAKARHRPKEWREDAFGIRRLVDWSKIPADWRMRHYEADDVRPAIDSVALCSQSAPKFAGTPFDLVVFDEINGQLSQVIGLDRPKDTLQGMQQLARQSLWCVALDSNGDVAAVHFLKSADRKPVVLDTPGTTAFAGRRLQVVSCLNASGLNAFEVNRAATFHRAVHDVLEHTGPVAVACSTKTSVATVAAMLRRAGIPNGKILTMSGADSVDTKNAFVTAFGNRDATSETDTYKVYIYSPAVTGGVSNFSCKLQLSLVCHYGPSIEALRQQAWRTRGAVEERVYVLDSAMLYARAPKLECTPVVDPPPDREGEIQSLTALKRRLEYEAMCRLVLGRNGLGATVNFEVDEGTPKARSWTRALNDTHYAKAESGFVRCQLGEPDAMPTLDEVELDACRTTGLARAAGDGVQGVLRNGEAYDAYLGAARADKFDAPHLVDQLKALAELEFRQRTANYLPFLRADCARLGVEYVEPKIIALNAKEQKAAQAELCNCLVQSCADLVLADIHFYDTVMCNLDPALLRTCMLTICAAKAITGRAGDREVVKDAHKKARKLLLALPDPEIRADFENCIDDDDDYYATNIVLSLDPLAGNGDESGDASNRDVALLQFNRLYYAKMSWSDKNLASLFTTTKECIKTYRGAERACTLDNMDEVKQVALSRAATAAVKAIRLFNSLFRRDMQAKFRTWAAVYDLRNTGKTATVCIEELQRELPASKRQKTDADLLLLHATDLALTTTGVKDGIFAKPVPKDDNTVALPVVPHFFASEAAVQSNYNERKGPFGNCINRTPEKLAAVKLISKEVASLCKGATARAAKVAFHESKPMENLSRLCTKAAAPMQMSLDKAKVKRGGDRELRKDPLLYMLGAHTKGLQADWDAFDDDKLYKRKNLEDISRQQRQEAVTRALNLLLEMARQHGQDQVMQ